MLKFTYTETGIHLEHLPQALLEDLITLRALLAMRTGERLIVEPGAAAFLLPKQLPELKLLKTDFQYDSPISVYSVDAEFVEIRLQGTWLSAQLDCNEGVFLTSLDERTELLIARLWQISFSQQSSLTRRRG